jgi:hypothetical protein
MQYSVHSAGGAGRLGRTCHAIASLLWGHSARTAQAHDAVHRLLQIVPRCLGLTTLHRKLSREFGFQHRQFAHGTAGGYPEARQRLLTLGESTL